MIANFPAALAFGWRPGYDNPGDGYHVTPGDAGGGTIGGVIEETWAAAVAKGIVAGTLRNATRDKLGLVLRDLFWGDACDGLPAGIDLMLYNGRMMSGGYPKLFQKAVGAVADGDVGQATIDAAKAIPATTLIEKLTVAHIYYLSNLGASWTLDHDGWEGRLLNAYTVALQMAEAPPAAPPIT
jgi:lysozyme family protein